MIWRFSKSSFKKYSPTFRWINLSFQKTVPKFDLNLTEGFGLSKSFRSAKKLSFKWASYLYGQNISTFTRPAKYILLISRLDCENQITCWFVKAFCKIGKLFKNTIFYFKDFLLSDFFFSLDVKPILLESLKFINRLRTIRNW